MSVIRNWSGTCRLDIAEACVRARQIKLMLTDVDGVLTDAGVYVGSEGDVMKRFNVRDGMGVELLRQAGIATCMVTRELGPIAEARARKLNLPKVYAGVLQKEALLPAILSEHNVTLSHVAYIGDDIIDSEIMRRIAREGLTATPFDGMPSVRSVAHYISGHNGGFGAFRDFVEWLLGMRAQ